MDHRVSKDMISSGMTPSGKKSQADLGKTQYGSAPSPNKLMDAYHSMYQDQKEQTLDEEGRNIFGSTPQLDKVEKIKKYKENADRVLRNKKPESPNDNTKNLNNSVDLLAAYRAVYEHHKKDEDGNTIPHEDDVKEGKIPAGLQAYLDKKKGKKKDDDDNGDDEKENKKKAKKDVKEGAGLYANIHAKRKRGGKMRKKGAKGAPSAQDFANAAKTAKEDFEKYDLVYNHFINEGFSEEEIYKRMSNLTEEQLDEFMGALAKFGMGLLKGGKVAAQSSKVASSVGGTAVKSSKFTKALNKVNNISKNSIPSAPSIPKTPPAAKTYAPTQSKVTTSGGKTATGTDLGANTIKPKNEILSTDNMMKAQIASSMLSGGGGQKKEKVGTVSASADLFDIVKGQLLDEGLSEEEIKDIMLTLTPEEILNEMGAKFPAGKGANYRETPKPKPQERLGTGRGADYVEKPKPKPGEPGSKFDAKGRKRYTGGMTPYSSENMKDT